MKKKILVLFSVAFVVFSIPGFATEVDHIMGEMAGEDV